MLRCSQQQQQRPVLPACHMSTPAATEPSTSKNCNRLSRASHSMSIIQQTSHFCCAHPTHNSRNQLYSTPHMVHPRGPDDPCSAAHSKRCTCCLLLHDHKAPTKQPGSSCCHAPHRSEAAHCEPTALATPAPEMNLVHSPQTCDPHNASIAPTLHSAPQVRLLVTPLVRSTSAKLPSAYIMLMAALIRSRPCVSRLHTYPCDSWLRPGSSSSCIHHTATMLVSINPTCAPSRSQHPQPALASYCLAPACPAPPALSAKNMFQSASTAAVFWAAAMGTPGCGAAAGLLAKGLSAAIASSGL
jgi:hypothetical protein